MQAANLFSSAGQNANEALVQKSCFLFKPVSLQVVPPIMVLFAKHPSVSNFDLSSIERITCGAAPLSAEIEEAVKNKLKLRNIQQGKIYV